MDPAPEQNQLVVLGLGWYELECDEKDAWRWTGERAEIFIRLPNDAYSYLSLNLASSQVDHKILVLANDAAELFRLELAQGTTGKICIPLERVKKIAICTNTFCPHEVNESCDWRHLGFRVDGFELTTKAGTSEQVPIRLVASAQDDIPAIFEDVVISDVARCVDATAFQEKRVAVSRKIKRGALLYMRDVVKGTLNNLGNYKMSADDGVKLITYSDAELPLKDCQKIPPLGDYTTGRVKSRDKYAFWAFVEGIRIAQEKGWDYFFCYEWDCCVGADRWFDILWDEHLAWPLCDEPAMTGTPCFRYPKINCGNVLYSAGEYIRLYERAAQVAMAVDYSSPVSLYANGALTFYNTREMGEFFYEALHSPGNKAELVERSGAWDLFAGRRLFQKYGLDMFKRVGWLPSSYSGWGDTYYSEAQRLDMLESSLKVAVHQIKYPQ